MTVREAAGLGPHARPLDPVDPPDRVENMLQDVLQALSKLDERVGELECRDPEDGEADPLVMEFKSRKSLEAAVNRLNEPPFASVSAMYSGELSRLRGDLMRAEGGLTKEIVSSAFEDLNHRVNNRLRNLGAPESKDPPDPHS